LKIELAPMEGITSYIYRNALCKFYGGVDTYFSPFISTHTNKALNFKEIKEIKPENNIGYKLVPQVLTANVDEFVFTSGQISEYGYDHINLNFGCPSGTVVPKGKGAGALLDVEKLDRLLDDIFMRTSMKISVKTRMGFSDYSEWEKLFEMYTKYPLEELIVHARVREDFYNGKAKSEILADYTNSSLNLIDKHGIKLSYNGDVFTVTDFEKVSKQMKNYSACMIGRGIICNPALAAEIKGEPELYDGGYSSEIKEGLDLYDGVNSSEKKSEPDSGSKTTAIEIRGTANSAGSSEWLDTFKKFNHELIEKYSEVMPGDKNTLFKLKELWVYMIKTFERRELSDDKKDNYVFDFKSTPESGESKKLIKSIRKCSSLKEYERIIDSL